MNYNSTNFENKQLKGLNKLLDSQIEELYTANTTLKVVLILVLAINLINIFI